MLCSKCNSIIEVPIVAYVKNGKACYRKQCESCYKARRVEYAKRTSEANVERVRQWRIDNPDKYAIQLEKHSVACKVSQKTPEYIQKRLKKDKLKIKEVANDYLKIIIKRTYGNDVEIPGWYLELRRQVLLLKREVGPLGRMPKDRKPRAPYDPINKKCPRCSLVKSRTEFGKRSNSKFSKSYCKCCESEIAQSIYYRKKLNETRRKGKPKITRNCRRD